MIRVELGAWEHATDSLKEGRAAGAGLQAYEVNEALGDDLPWWATVASFIPELSAAVPAGEAIR